MIVLNKLKGCHLNFKKCVLQQLSLSYGFGTRHKVHEIKNNSMVIIEDQQKILPYLGEVELQNGKRGIVMKIQDNGSVYVGMYEEIGNKTPQIKQITINKIVKNWKQSTNQLAQQILQHSSQNSTVFDVNLHSIFQKKISLPQQTQQNFHIYNANKRRLKAASPLLNTCYDLYYGDMISFFGCKGSRKFQNAISISKQFSSPQSNHLSIYVNPYYKQVQQFISKTPSSISFSVPEFNRSTNVGIYMMTLKAIRLGNELKKHGLDVLLIVDRVNDIMLHQWNLLQSIKFNQKLSDSSKLFQYNTLKISPISIFNQIYSSCQDKQSQLPGSQLLLKSVKKSQGSLTSLLIADKQNNQLIQQITSYSNNLKHLQTLSKVIQFPLNFKINSNLYYKKPKNSEEQQKLNQQKGFSQKQIYRFLRSYVNRYLREKQESELKRQLYKNQLRDAPWDYFFILDSEWWIKGLKEMENQLNSYKSAILFLKWIIYNIENDHIGHWDITAKESFKQFLSYVKRKHNMEQNISIEMIEYNEEEAREFVDDAKMDGLLNPFKKDYLL